MNLKRFLDVIIVLLLVAVWPLAHYAENSNLIPSAVEVSPRVLLILTSAVVAIAFAAWRGKWFSAHKPTHGRK